MAAAALVALTGGAATGVEVPHPEAAAPEGATSCWRDTVAPRVSSVTFSALEVDVTHASARVVVDLQVTDFAAPEADVSGVARVRVRWDVAGDSTGIRWFQPVHRTASTWRGVLTVPRGGRPGTWTVQSIEVRDAAWNWLSYQNPASEYAGAGPAVDPSWPTTLRITDLAPDTLRPVIRSVAFSPRSVDTTRRPAYVRVRVRAVDDTAVVGATFTLHRGGDEDYDTYLSTSLTAQADGWFTGRLRVRRWLEQGSWAPPDDAVWLAIVSVWDANSLVRRTGRGLTREGWPSTVRIVSSPRPVPDVTAIVVKHPIQLKRGGVRLPVSLAVDGDGAAIPAVDVTAYHRPGWSTGWGIGHLRLTSGTHRQGTWTGSIVVEPCAGAGRYALTAWLQRGQRWLWIGNRPLVRRGAPADIVLPTLPGDDRPPRAALEVAAADRLAVVFDEGVRDVVPAVSLVTATTGAPIDVTSVTCLAANGDPVPCSGGDAIVRRAELVLARPLDLTTGVEVRLNERVPVPQITDRGANPVNETLSMLAFRPPEV